MKKYITLAVVALAFLFATVRLFSFIDRYSVNLITWDHFDVFDAIVSENSILRVFLWQQNAHRVGAGLLVLKGAALLTHWNTRSETFITGILLTLTAVVALLLKHRLTKRISITDSIIPFIFLTLFQVDNLLHGFQLVFILPVTVLLLVLYISSYPLSTARGLLLITLALLGTFSSFQGLFIDIFLFIFFIRLVLYHQTGKKQIIISMYAFCSICLFALYFAGFNWSLVKSSGTPAIIQILQSTSGLISNVTGAYITSAAGYFAPAVFFLLFLYIVLRAVKHPQSNTYFPIICLYMYSFLFSISIAFERSAGDMELAYLTRYISHMLPLYLAAYITLSLFKNTLRQTLGLTLFILYFIITGSVNQFKIYEEASYLNTGATRWRTCYLETKNPVECTQLTQFQIIREGRMDFMLPKLDLLEQKHLSIFSENTYQ